MPFDHDLVSVIVGQKNKRKRVYLNLKSFSFAVIILLVTTAISLSSHKANSTTLNNETDRVTLLALPGTLSCNNTLQKHYNNSLFAEALNSVRDDLEHLWKSEGKMPKLGVNTPSYRHQMVTATSAKSNELALIGLQEEFAAKKYYSKYVC